jgi:hypothetical protein
VKPLQALLKLSNRFQTRLKSSGFSGTNIALSGPIFLPQASEVVMSEELDMILGDHMGSKERTQGWIMAFGCLAVIVGVAGYLIYNAFEEKRRFDGYSEALVPVVSQLDHPFDALDYPVDMFDQPTMNIWPKADWKTIPLNDERSSKIVIMGQSKLQGRIYGVDLFHTGNTQYISPVDISLGWKDAASSDAYEEAEVGHSEREATLKAPEDWPKHQFTNAHLIPADWAIYQALKDAQPDDRIALTAWPVTYHSKGYSSWVSDRNYGDRDCEILLITAVRIERPDGYIRGEAEI